MHHTRPISLLICALGGEGGGVLTEWLVNIARLAGYAAQSTSIPGVAQRTGATTYFIEVFPVPMTQLGARRPVFSLNPIPGALDGVISSELLETARCASNGLPSPERTLIITSSSRTLSTTERTHPGDGRLDNLQLLKLVQGACRGHHVLDMQAIARDHGTVVSAVMLGAIAASGLFPFPKATYLQVVKAGGRGAEASVAGFEAAWLQISQINANTQRAQKLVDEIARSQTPQTPQTKTVPDALRAFPESVQAMLALGHARVCEYQNGAYGERYLARMAAVLAAEQAADPAHEHDYAVTREMARWVALWMAFDDIVRVAQLKSRMARSKRVQAEVKLKSGDLLKVYEHFKPGAAEFAALLPKPLAQRVSAWNRQRMAEGKASWAMPIKLGSHTVAGMLALRGLASMKWLRQYGSRFDEEQALIDAWSTAVQDGLADGWQLGHEIALCGRLIKGYGSTNERGKENLLHVVRHLALPTWGNATERADAIRQARVAALGDDEGKTLDQTLAKLGAPARAVKAQPIRWMPRSPVQ